MNNRDTIWFVLALVIVAIVTFGYVNRRHLVERYSQHQRVQQQTQAAKEQSRRLEKEIEGTRQRIEHLGSDPTEIEAAIRRSKDLVREGEKIYRIEKAPSEAPQ